MTIRLVKKHQQHAAEQKPAQQPSAGELLSNAQSWVEEFKARKASNNAAMLGMLRRSQA
jgi:hypothetical protein